MISISVKGVRSKKKVRQLEYACELYMKKLGFRQFKRMLEIKIILCEQEEDGLCDFIDDPIFPEVEITIKNSLSDVERLKTLAHELTHAKQFIRKELQFKDHQILWKGQPSDKEEWEDEAYLMEDKLYNEYMNDRPDERTSSHSIQHIS